MLGNQCLCCLCQISDTNATLSKYSMASITNNSQCKFTFFGQILYGFNQIPYANIHYFPIYSIKNPKKSPKIKFIYDLWISYCVQIWLHISDFIKFCIRFGLMLRQYISVWYCVNGISWGQIKKTVCIHILQCSLCCFRAYVAWRETMRNFARKLNIKCNKKRTKQNIQGFDCYNGKFYWKNVGLDWSIYGSQLYFINSLQLIIHRSNFAQKLRCLYLMFCRFFCPILTSVCLFFFFVIVSCFLSKKKHTLTRQQNQGNITQPTMPTNFQTLWQLSLVCTFVFFHRTYKMNPKQKSKQLLIQTQELFVVFVCIVSHTNR